MIVPLRLSALAATGALVAGLVSGCTSSGPSSPTAGPSASSSPALTPDGLASAIEDGMSKTSSAHLDADASDLGVKVSGDLKLDSGQTSASHLTVAQGGQQVEVISVGDTSWAKLPAGQRLGGKPWVVVSSKSRNDFVRGLAGTLNLVTAVASVDEIASIVRAAQSVRRVGPAPSGGTSYDVVVDPTHVQGRLGALLHLTAEKQVPIALTLDGSNRPTEAHVATSVAGAPVKIVIKVSHYNAPVSVSAPPSGQVAGG